MKLQDGGSPWLAHSGTMTRPAARRVLLCWEKLGTHSWVHTISARLQLYILFTRERRPDDGLLGVCTLAEIPRHIVVLSHVADLLAHGHHELHSPRGEHAWHTGNEQGSASE